MFVASHASYPYNAITFLNLAASSLCCRSLMRLSFAADARDRYRGRLPVNLYHLAFIHEKHRPSLLYAKYKVQFNTGSLSDSDTSVILIAPSGGNRAKSTTVNARSAAA